MLKTFCIAILLISSILKVNLTGLCRNREKTCNYDSNNSSRCIPAECNAPYGFQCGTDYCSSNKLLCDYYKNYNLVLYLVENKENKRFHKKLISSIIDCSKVIYEFKSTDVCLNEAGCVEKKIIQLRYNKIVSTKQINCPCTEAHSYQCINKICSINKRACEIYLNKFSLDYSNLKSCGNNLTIAKN